MKTYEVMRRHRGDKPYLRGDKREAKPDDVQHLVDAGVLREVKAAPKPKNKAEEAPKNKAAD